MADKTDANITEKDTSPTVENPTNTQRVVDSADSPVGQTLEPTPVAAPANAQIGDEATASINPIQVEVVQEDVPAQVTGAPAVPVEVVRVHETHVTTDRVITDPNSPEAVQIPDAGRGALDLPIHALSNPSPEEVFAAQA
jgi:hypothetical protein